MSSDLLPCPFCGSEHVQIFSNKMGDFYARCHSDEDDVYACGASTSDRQCESEEQAIRRWNVRPSVSGGGEKHVVRYERAKGGTFSEMLDNVWKNNDTVKFGDTILVWANEGDLCMYGEEPSSRAALKPPVGE